jgi:hypothetical protein
MAWDKSAAPVSSGEERQSMVEDLVLLALCFVVAVMGLTVVAL